MDGRLLDSLNRAAAKKAGLETSIDPRLGCIIRLDCFALISFNLLWNLLMNGLILALNSSEPRLLARSFREKDEKEFESDSTIDESSLRAAIEFRFLRRFIS